MINWYISNKTKNKNNITYVGKYIKIIEKYLIKECKKKSIILLQSSIHTTDGIMNSCMIVNHYGTVGYVKNIFVHNIIKKSTLKESIEFIKRLKK